MKNISLIFSILFLISLGACKPGDSSIVLKGTNLGSDLQKTLINAKPGDAIRLPEGRFDFQRSISLTDIPNISIIGAGKGKTVLNFKAQIEGAEGLLIKNVTGLLLEGFTVADSKGDAIKVQGCTNVIMRELETTWTNGQRATNGAYGLYPVSCTNVLMEWCEASYAMDAGIYIGQSRNVSIHDNYAHHNVAGIEIENTIVGEIYDNIARSNAGGMLIFDMPDLPQANGDRIKFYNNLIEANNGQNFAPDGMVVSTIPPGSGMIIMSHTNIEAYNNVIRDHKTLGLAINSWLSTGMPFESEEFDPFCTNIYIHDNQFINTEGPTDGTTEYGKLFKEVLNAEAYDIITDGIFKPSTVNDQGRPTGICLQNNGDVSFVNLNLAMGNEPSQILKNLDHDLNFFDCTLDAFDTREHNAWIAK